MRKTVLFTILSAAILGANANELYLDLSAESAHAQFDATHASNNIHYSAALLFTDDEGELFSAGAMAKGTIGGSPSLTGGLGARAYIVNADTEDFMALALGGSVKYSIAELEGLSLYAEAFYAPSITVTEDYENFSELTFRLNYAVFENASIYAGTRRVAARHEISGTGELDDNIHAGIRIDF